MLQLDGRQEMMLSLLPANVALAFREGLHSPPCEARVAPSRYPAARAAEQGCWLLLGATPPPFRSTSSHRLQSDLSLHSVIWWLGE